MTTDEAAPVAAGQATASTVRRHRELLDRAVRATRERGYFSAFPESPSPRVYGETAAADGRQAFDALLGNRFPLDQDAAGGWVGAEHSPYGRDLGVTYPRPDLEAAVVRVRAAVPAWRDSGPLVRASLCIEMLVRINERSFEMAHAVMHTSGQAFVMAFQAGGPHAQDRALEAVAYAYEEQSRYPASALWEKPQGRRAPLRMEKTFTVVPRGIGLVIGCSTFPTWNSYPGLFASLATGNGVLVKPHPQAVLPLAITLQVVRQVLSDNGFDPDLAVLVPEGDSELLAADLALRPEVGIVDFTGSSAFGTWLEEHARQAQVYTEKSGVNAVVLDSTDAYRAALGNLAFSLALYSGQMCTTPQNIYLPRDGIDTDEGRKSVTDVAADLGAALGRLLGDDAAAAELLGAIVNLDVLDRLERAETHGHVVVASRVVHHPAWPDARIRTPAVLVVDVTDTGQHEQECFGPVSFLVTTDSTQESVDAFHRVTKARGALTAAVYSTDDTVLEGVRQAALDVGVALSENLTGAVFVNQSAAFSDFHATGANPAANATYTDGHYVAGRFRVVQSRRHLAADDAPG